jgi:hypothetical protein
MQSTEQWGWNPTGGPNLDGGWEKIHVDAIGVARTRWVNVLTATAPVEATSGWARFIAPVRRVEILSLRVVSLTSFALTQGADWTVRYAINPVHDAHALLMIPTAAPTGSATAEGGEIGSFNVIPIFVPDTEAAGDLRVANIDLPPNLKIDLASGITSLAFTHNIGTAVLMQLHIRALEAI